MNEFILEKTAKEYYEMAEYAYKNTKPNSAVILYFKAFVALIDLYLLKNIETTPSSHTERFRLVEKHFPSIYNLLDKNFPFYQDSYTQEMSLELAEIIKNDAQLIGNRFSGDWGTRPGRSFWRAVS